jgi:hypothetical protein
VIARLPNDFRKVSAAFNLGVPLMENHDNSLTNNYRALASLLTGVRAQQESKRGGIGNFFSNKR